MDMMFRANDKAAWDAFAASAGLTDAGVPTDCLIDEIGQIMMTPPVFSADGTILTPAVMDNHHHVNVRLSGGHDLAVLAQGAQGVEWIDPATVSSPSRIWAGGMDYWMPETKTMQPVN